jgi:hypothetical protein
MSQAGHYGLAEDGAPRGRPEPCEEAPARGFSFETAGIRFPAGEIRLGLQRSPRDLGDEAGRRHRGFASRVGSGKSGRAGDFGRSWRVSGEDSSYIFTPAIQGVYLASTPALVQIRSHMLRIRARSHRTLRGRARQLAGDTTPSALPPVSSGRVRPGQIREIS